MLLDNVRNYLANYPPINLQISPRARLSGSHANIVPASSANFTGAINLALPVLGQPNSAWWFDYVAGSITVSAVGLTITDLGLFFANSAQSLILPAGQPVLTTLSVQNTTGLIFQMPTPLVQLEDIQAEANLAAVPFAEPGFFTLLVSVKNAIASAITMTLALNVLVRSVRGLQEG